MIELKVYQGQPNQWSLQTVVRADADGINPYAIAPRSGTLLDPNIATALQPVTFLESDVLSGEIWQGQGQTPLATFTPTWYSPTGYENGTITAALTGAISAAFDLNGMYRFLISATRSGNTWAIFESTLTCLDPGGSGTQLFVPYCSYEDMLNIAPWVANVEDFDTDQEGFYSQRILARNWMDAAILNAYRGSYVGLFEGLSEAAFRFGYVGYRRSLGPSPSLSTYLEQNLLMLARSDGSPTQIVRCCAHRAISEVGLAQVGGTPTFYQFGLYHRDMATKCAFSTTAEINLSGTGTDVGNLFINLGSTNTLST